MLAARVEPNQPDTDAHASVVHFKDQSPSGDPILYKNSPLIMWISCHQNKLNAEITQSNPHSTQ